VGHRRPIELSVEGLVSELVSARTRADKEESMSAAAHDSKDRRRASVASYSFVPVPQQLRSLRADVEKRLSVLDGDYSELQRKVLLLLGEIVSRLLTSSLDGALHIDLEIKIGTVRIDVWQESADGPCEVHDLLEDPVVRELAWACGKDRRRACGAWFEFVTPAD
jgi:hypothetical protein